MRKMGLSLIITLLISLVFTPAFASSTIAEGDGHFRFQTIDQNFDPPPQWIVKYLRLGVDIGVGFQMHCSPAGIINIWGQIDKDGTHIWMSFKTGGLVFRQTRLGKYFLFNGAGSFCLYRPGVDGNFPSVHNIIEGAIDDGFGGWEHGKAIIDGKATFNPRNGIGKFVQTTIDGGNFGFLFRGVLTGTVYINEE